MIEPVDLLNAFVDHDVTFFTGVPDSLLKEFCFLVSRELPAERHVIAANEGNAVAIAAGHFVATGNPALVYMQNSGLGNAVNPLTSLADPEVYSIPMILLIGWRGQPGCPDEPQHVKQGRITCAMLDSMGIPFVVIGPETRNISELVSELKATASGDRRPVAILAKEGTFAKATEPAPRSETLSVSRETAIQKVAALAPEQAVIVSTTGKASRELYECRISAGASGERDFLTVGSMGHASSIALGIALARPSDRVICLDGDGAALMHLGSMCIIGQSTCANLLHIVLNNGAHESVGGQPTVGYNVNLSGIAQSAGYRVLSPVKTEGELELALAAALSDAVGPTFLEVLVTSGSRNDLTRPKDAPIDNIRSLMAALSTTA
jgi:phosphonopyruvate decarboxylase